MDKTQPQVNEDILPVDEPGTVREGEGISDWMMIGEEYALAAEIDLKVRKLESISIKLHTSTTTIKVCAIVSSSST